jgi:hypothetical protein
VEGEHGRRATLLQTEPLHMRKAIGNRFVGSTIWNIGV